MDPKLEQVTKLIQDYTFILENDPEYLVKSLFLVDRYLMTGKDLTDEELEDLNQFIRRKIDQYVKEKGN